MKITFFIISVFLITLCCKKQVNSFSSISSKKDSISFYLKKSKNKQLAYSERLNKINNAYKNIDLHNTDSLDLAIILRKTQIHFDLNQYDSVSYFNNQLLKDSKETYNIYFNAQYHYIKSYYHDLVTHKKDSVFYHNYKAIEYFSLINDSSNIGKRLINLAHLQFESIDHHGSIESSLNSLKYLSTKQDSRYIASAYDIIAANYQELKMYQEAIENQKKSLNYFTGDEFIYLNNLAVIHSQFNQIDKSIKTLDSIDISKIKFLEEKALLTDNLFYFKWLQNPELNIEKELDKALKTRIESDDLWGLIDSYEHLALYYSKKEPQKAIAFAFAFANQLIETSKLIVHPKGELKGLKIIMDINTQDTKSRDRYIRLNDSLNLAHLKVRNQYAKIKYDNQQALEENDSLRLKNKYQQVLKTRYALLAIIILLILAFYIYHTLQKRKQARQKFEQEKLQAVYKTETGISKKIHDEVANGIFQVMAQVENENNPLSKNYIDKLDHIYKKTRDISHQISEIDLNEGYPMELEGMLEDYQIHTIKVVVHHIETIPWHSISTIKKETIYRVLNELMVNMKKHSQAKLVTIRFALKKGKVKIQYTDNGLGINKSELVFGTGLKNVENRIQSIQGTFIFDSNPNQGLQITIVLPI